MLKKILFGFILILLFMIISYKKTNGFLDEASSSNKSDNNNENNIINDRVGASNIIKFVATGDALIHTNIFNDAKNDNGYDFNDQIEYIKPIIKKYDLAFYNQETLFAGEEMKFSGYPKFNTPSQFGDAMIDAGFNLVSLANNHSFDKGEKGILNAINYWENKSVMWNGLGKDQNESSIISIQNKNNISYALLAYTTFTNGHNTPSKVKVNYYNYNKVKSDIEKIKDKTDVIIVSIHWGKEYSHEVNSKQRKIAQELSDLGVNIIIGHHPHVLQPIEKINNTLVMYSLGNFISDQDTSNKLTGALVSFDIKKDPITNNITFSDPEVDLTYTFKGKPYNGFKVVPFNQINQYTLFDANKIYENAAKIITGLDNNIFVKPMKNTASNIFAAVVPHHNFVKTEREIFWQDLLYNSNIDPIKIEKVIIIGPDHFGKNKNNITYDNTSWTTFGTELNNFFEDPLYFPSNYVLNTKLVKNDHTIVNLVGEVHDNFPNAVFVPYIIGGKVKFKDLAYIQKYIIDNCSNNCALISSVDFSHYVNLEQIEKQDKRTIDLLSKKTITETSFNQNNYVEVDCPAALYIMQEFAKKHELKWELFNKTNSAQGNLTTTNTTSHIFGVYKK